MGSILAPLFMETSNGDSKAFFEASLMDMILFGDVEGVDWGLMRSVGSYT